MPDPAALEMASGANAKPALSATTDHPVLDITKRDEQGKFQSEQVKAEPKGETSEESATPPGDETTANDTAQHADKSVQKRIDQLTKDKREAERRAEEATQRAAEFERQQQQQAEARKGQETEDAAPRRDAFEDPDDYTIALSAWTARKAVREDRATQAQAMQQYRAREQFTRMESDWQAGRIKAIEKYPDFVEVVDNDQLQIAQHVAFAIKASAKGHDIAYYLGKHPEEAARLSQLSPLQSAIAIGELHSKLDKPDVSRAPAPIRPVGQRSADRGSSKELSMDEYAAQRNEKLRKRS